MYRELSGEPRIPRLHRRNPAATVACAYNGGSGYPNATHVGGRAGLGRRTAVRAANAVRPVLQPAGSSPQRLADPAESVHGSNDGRDRGTLVRKNPSLARSNDRRDRGTDPCEPTLRRTRRSRARSGRLPGETTVRRGAYRCCTTRNLPGGFLFPGLARTRTARPFYRSRTPRPPAFIHSLLDRIHISEHLQTGDSPLGTRDKGAHHRR
jgi:hypothetical protein